MAEAHPGATGAQPAARGWRRLVLAALIMALSMAIATVLIPPDPDAATATAEPDR
jgi:hypothetical protein